MSRILVVYLMIIASSFSAFAAGPASQIRCIAAVESLSRIPQFDALTPDQRSFLQSHYDYLRLEREAHLASIARCSVHAVCSGIPEFPDRYSFTIESNVANPIATFTIEKKRVTLRLPAASIESELAFLPAAALASISRLNLLSIDGLAIYSEKELSNLVGFGPTTARKLREFLATKNIFIEPYERQPVSTRNSQELQELISQKKVWLRQNVNALNDSYPNMYFTAFAAGETLPASTQIYLRRLLDIFSVDTNTQELSSRSNLGLLSLNEKEILLNFWKLKDSPLLTYKAIGESLRLTGFRIKQLHRKAMLKVAQLSQNYFISEETAAPLTEKFLN